MILRRVTQHVKGENWFAVGLDFVIVVVGVFIGIQVANWNEARLANVRKTQIVEALTTDLNDAIKVQERFIEQIESGLSEWEQSHARGERPAPYYFRITGSDTAPDTWGMLQQMQLADLLDPVTLFDLSFYYSRLVWGENIFAMSSLSKKTSCHIRKQIKKYSMRMESRVWDRPTRQIWIACENFETSLSN